MRLHLCSPPLACPAQNSHSDAASDEVDTLRGKLIAQQDLCVELTRERDTLLQNLRDNEVRLTGRRRAVFIWCRGGSKQPTDRVIPFATLALHRQSCGRQRRGQGKAVSGDGEERCILRILV